MERLHFHSAWFWIFAAVFTVRNLSEWRLVRGRVQGEPGARTGGATLAVFVFSHFLCGFGAGAWLLLQDPRPKSFAIGCIGFLALHWLRTRILRGSFAGSWNPFTTPLTKSALVVDGPYRLIRHPVYLLNVLELGCLWLVLPNPVALAGWLLDLVATLLRIPGEERLLARRFGAEWNAYRSRTSRLLPGIW